MVTPTTHISDVARELGIILGKNLDDADLELKIADFAPGRARRAAVMTALVGLGGSKLASYLNRNSTIGDIIHWVETIRANAASIDSDPDYKIRLRSLDESDLSPLYRAAMDPKRGYRWRFRGTTVSPDEFQRTLWGGTFVQFMVEGAVDRERYGLVTAYNAQPDLGHAYIATYRCSERPGRGEMMIGTFLLINHLFGTFPFRKLYAEVPGYNEAELGLSEFAPFTLESTLKEHDFYGGNWWDHHTFSTWRDDWAEFAGSLGPYIAKLSE